jgi:thioredoxin 1
MATIDVTEQNFAEITGREGIVILDFWATWCGACKAFAPVYEAASDSNPDIVFGKVDAEDAGQLAASLGIRGLPTLAIYRDSIMVFFQAGALPKPELNAVIARVRSLDMDRVRAEVESRPHQPGHVHHG